jgi:hypothetical protein
MHSRCLQMHSMPTQLYMRFLRTHLSGHVLICISVKHISKYIHNLQTHFKRIIADISFDAILFHTSLETSFLVEFRADTSLESFLSHTSLDTFLSDIFRCLLHTHAHARTHTHLCKQATLNDTSLNAFQAGTSLMHSLEK